MNRHYNHIDRKDFLINLYNQLCAEIDRHIKVVWQTIGLLLSTFAIFALVEKDILPLDIASAIIFLVSGFSAAIVIESNFWYNRNLVIIANIEKQFLHDDDQKDIHWYFGQHRKDNKYLDMMLIQIVFVLILIGIVIFYHFSKRVFPNFDQPISNFDIPRAIPYIVLIVTSILLWKFHRKRIEDYNEFKRKSPGIPIKMISDSRPSSDHEV